MGQVAAEIPARGMTEGCSHPSPAAPEQLKPRGHFAVGWAIIARTREARLMRAVGCICPACLWKQETKRSVSDQAGGGSVTPGAVAVLPSGRECPAADGSSRRHGASDAKSSLVCAADCTLWRFAMVLWPFCNKTGLACQ